MCAIFRCPNKIKMCLMKNVDYLSASQTIFPVETLLVTYFLD